MSNVKIVLNSAGIEAMLKSDGVANMLQELGNDIAQRAGNGYAAHIETSSDRKKAFVTAETAEARRDNLKNNTLLKALR